MLKKISGFTLAIIISSFFFMACSSSETAKKDPADPVIPDPDPDEFSISITNPLNADKLVKGQTFTISGSITGGAGTIQVFISIDDDPEQTAVVSGTTWEKTDMTLETLGSHTITVYAEDANSELTADAVITVDCIDWEILGSEGFSDSGIFMNMVAVAPDGTPYAGYKNSSDKYIVKKFNGDDWELVGTDNWSGTTIDCPKLVIAPNGTPYVIYMNSDTKVEVRKWTGTAWEIAGAAFNHSTTAEGWRPSLAFSTDSTPYAVYQNTHLMDLAYISVQKFTGTDWVLVGIENFSAKIKDESARIAIAPDGTPYVSFESWIDNDNQSTSVMKFDGSNWVLVGTEKFSDGNARSTSIQISSDNIPYVAFQDWGGSSAQTASVMKFNGTAWIYVGTRQFSSGVNASMMSFALDSDDLPYIAFSDMDKNNQATVMKFSGTSWITVGSKGFSTEVSNTGFVSLAISTDGKLYTCYIGTLDNKISVMNF